MTLHLSRLLRQLICESTHNYTNLLTHTHTHSLVSVFDLLLFALHLFSPLVRAQYTRLFSLSLSAHSLSLSLSFIFADSENEANKFFSFLR